MHGASCARFLVNRHADFSPSITSRQPTLWELWSDWQQYSMIRSILWGAILTSSFRLVFPATRSMIGKKPPTLIAWSTMPGINRPALFQSAIGRCVPSFVKNTAHITIGKFCRPKQTWPPAYWRLSMTEGRFLRLSLKIASVWGEFHMVWTDTHQAHLAL